MASQLRLLDNKFPPLHIPSYRCKRNPFAMIGSLSVHHRNAICGDVIRFLSSKDFFTTAFGKKRKFEMRLVVPNGDLIKSVGKLIKTITSEGYDLCDLHDPLQLMKVHPTKKIPLGRDKTDSYAIFFVNSRDPDRSFKLGMDRLGDNFLVVSDIPQDLSLVCFAVRRFVD